MGHDEGDKVLVAFSRALRHVLTAKQALAARWGGDEFVIAGKEKGLGENIREQIRKDLEKNDELPFIPLFSIGVYQCFTPNMTLEQVLQKADERLYKDKEIQHENKNIFHQKLREIRQSMEGF